MTATLTTRAPAAPTPPSATLAASITATVNAVAEPAALAPLTRPALDAPAGVLVAWHQATTANTLIELSALALSRPTPDAPADVVAAWYEAKGRVHEHLAAQSTGAEATTELQHAVAAYEHARRLLASPPQHSGLADGGMLR